MDDDMTTIGRKREVLEHLNHVTYPASKQDLVNACNGMEHVPEEDKKWFADNLADQMFNSATEVEQSLAASM